MAELQLSLRYKTLPTTVGFAAMCMLSPVWALGAPVTLGLFLGHAIRFPATLSSPAAIAVFPILLAIIFLGILLTAISEDDRVYVSKQGISFPLFMLPLLGFRRSRYWQELTNADVTVSTQDNQEQILLRFAGGISLKLKRSSVAATAMEQLLLALELWARHCQCSPEFLAFQRNIQSEVRQENKLGSILEYLHGQEPPVVHRDFTPDNLILAKSGTLKLIDFNVAQQQESTTTGTVVGKQAYLPPEQFRGQPCPQSDLYGLGATLFYLLTGHDPVAITCSHPQELEPAVSSLLDSIVAQATALELAERFANVQAIKPLLSSAVAGKQGTRLIG
jgi:hypothetical protein